MSNPVRIYVLHHPDSKLGARLADQIYEWFRLTSLEGIPVYLRSWPVPGKERPHMPYRKPGDACVEYIVPLVDGTMVRDAIWHHYLADVALECLKSEDEDCKWGMKMFPVALDSTAFNVPDGISRMNFIRHGSGAPPIVVTKAAPDEKEKEKEKEAREKDEVEETLKHLTAAIARDLNARLFPEQQGERFKIFISYARADSTEEAKTLRNYIQGQTQCLVFFDENDIGFGGAFDESIDENVSVHSRALIVLNSDHYADRPWCRFEIERFTRPKKFSLRYGKKAGRRQVQVFNPLLVVDNMKGPKMTRVVPELAQAPIVRWTSKCERLCFSTLMREVVLGLRDVMDAELLFADAEGSLAGVVVNRLPGPVALAQLPGVNSATEKRPLTLHHPGHGLPLTELRLLERTFPSLRFKAFRDIYRYMPQKMQTMFAQIEKASAVHAPLLGKVIGISTAHDRKDLAGIGYLPQHQDEALIHLLRPLLRLGADLLYGGRPPNRDMEAEAARKGLQQRNITLTLMQMLGSERSEVQSPSATAKSGSRRDQAARNAAREAHKQAVQPRSGPMLFNLSTWPKCGSITAMDEAAWINACHVRRVVPNEVPGLGDWQGEPPAEDGLPGIGQRRFTALVLTHMRGLLADGFRCRVPGNLDRFVAADAFVFIGGSTGVFKSVMPGVMEEFLSVARSKRAVPIYLMGGLGGATGVIARAILKEKDGVRAPELTMEFYESDQSENHAEFRALMSELSEEERACVKQQFDDLWLLIERVRATGNLDNLLGNRLTDKENRELLTTTSTTQAVKIIWQGLCRVFEREMQPVTPNVAL